MTVLLVAVLAGLGGFAVGWCFGFALFAVARQLQPIAMPGMY